LRLFIAFGACAVWTSIPANAQDKPAAKIHWAKAIIYVDGAAVYSRADFDSPVQDYLRYQTPVWAGLKPYQGVSGMGLFHIISYGKKKGYVPDTDIRFNKKIAAKVPKTVKQKSRSKAWEKEEEQMYGKAPIYFTRYLGAAASYVNFTEKFSHKAYHSGMLMYGLRMTGTGTLITDGPPLDFNLWFSMDKPDYYKKFTSKTPRGFLVFGDIMAMLPLVDHKRFIVNYGIGLMYVFTKYSVDINNKTYDSSEFRIGADAGLGVGVKLGQYIVRFDGKYYYEKTQYFGGVLSFQGEY
jgi:hypothetical protein